MSKKNEFGKGIKALLSNIENKNTTLQEKREIVKELTNNIVLIRLEAIEVNPFQPRIDFDTEELMELAKSIKVHGLIQPITVRAVGGDKYQLISGERRLRASKMAGLSEVPAFIRTANDQEMLEMALIENIQRADLNALEVAISYQRLMDECNLTHESLSDRVGKNRSTVTNYVRLLKLPPEIQNTIKSGQISMGHARALAGISEVDKQLFTFKTLLDKEYSVRDLEAYIKNNTEGNSKSEKATTSTKAIANATSTELERIKKEWSHLFGTMVDIKRDNNGKGQIVIKFGNDREFNSIYDLLKEIE